MFTKNWIFCSGNICLVKTVNLTTTNILKLLNRNCFDFCWDHYGPNIFSLNFTLKLPKADIFKNMIYIRISSQHPIDFQFLKLWLQIYQTQNKKNINADKIMRVKNVWNMIYLMYAMSPVGKIRKVQRFQEKKALWKNWVNSR